MMRATTRIAVATAVLAAGLTTVPAGAAVAPKPTSPAARQAPYVAVAHKLLLKAPVKAKATASFRATGLANVPSTASAVVVSVSVPNPVAAGTLTFFSYGTKRPATVSLAYAKGRTATSTVVLIPGTAGKVSVYNASTKGDKIVATVTGFYAAPGSTSAANAKTRFVALPPKRVSSAALGKAAAAFATGVPATGVAGVVLSVTVPAPAKSGSLSLYGYGARPAAADFSFTAHHPSSSLVVVPVGSQGRVSVLNHAKAVVRVWVDVVGYLHQLKAPSAPRSVVATAQNGGALITWSSPASDGGAPVAAYRLEVVPGGTTMVVPGQALQTSVGNLRNGTSYTFAVVAMNSVGSSPATISAAVVPYGVPAAPTNLVAKASDVGSATLTWAAPTDTGGLPITGYKVTASGGGATATSTTTSATVSGLPSGQYFTFTVTATNGPATSLPSAPSSAVLGEGTSRVLPTGTTSAADEDDAALSADGRYVAFDSDARLTADDRNNYQDVYVRDRLLGTTTLVSVPAAGSTATDNDSLAPSISDDGRYVAFQSMASDLVSPETMHEDVYLRDLLSHTTRLISASSAGFEGDGASENVVISGDGSTVVFGSQATNLVSTSNGGKEQLYVETLTPRSVRIASAPSSSGAPGNEDTYSGTLSSDGHRVAFTSLATNLVSGVTTGGYLQAYVYDSTADATSIVSFSAANAMHGGNERSYQPFVSPDGGYVAFVSQATDILGGNGVAAVYLRTLSSGAVVKVSSGAGGADPSDDSNFPIVSTGGRYVVFTSAAHNLNAGGDTNNRRDVFRTDTTTGVTQLVSVADTGAQGDGDSNGQAMTRDGLHVAFSSQADNLVPADTNGYTDLFVRDLG